MQTLANYPKVSSGTALENNPIILHKIPYSSNFQGDETMRLDLQNSLKRAHINPSDLSIFQRILLTTNGTVTDMLEAYLFEQIQLVKLSENLVQTENDIPPIQVKKNDRVIKREVLLRGKISRRNFIYANSVVFVENLDERFQNELINTKTPIGKLWFEQKVENFKEIIDSGKEPAQELSHYFGIQPEENILFRTYYVYSKGKPTMMITEKFPESYFVQNV